MSNETKIERELGRAIGFLGDTCRDNGLPRPFLLVFGNEADKQLKAIPRPSRHDWSNDVHLVVVDSATLCTAKDARKCLSAAPQPQGPPSWPPSALTKAERELLMLVADKLWRVGNLHPLDVVRIRELQREVLGKPLGDDVHVEPIVVHVEPAARPAYIFSERSVWMVPGSYSGED